MGNDAESQLIARTRIILDSVTPPTKMTCSMNCLGVATTPLRTQPREGLRTQSVWNE